MNKPDTEKLTLVLWNYLKLNMELQKADIIIALGSHDLHVAERAAQLYLDGWAPLIAMSGGVGKLTKSTWKSTEAEKFTEIALEMGVPEDKIIKESQSTNTAENIEFTHKLLDEKQIGCKRILAVQKPYMERRAYLTFKKHWPDVDVIMSSPDIPFAKYEANDSLRYEMINIIVGDMQRIIEYPKKGYITAPEDPLPDDVLKAYKELVSLGYTHHLIKV